MRHATDDDRPSGTVAIKTRIPLYLHLALRDAAQRNDRSLAAEIRAAIRAHLETETKQQ